MKRKFCAGHLAHHPPLLLALLVFTFFRQAVIISAQTNSQSEQCSLQDGQQGTCPADLSHTTATPSQNAASASQPGSIEGSRWIVRFRRYSHASQHHATLSQQVHGEGVSWRWVDRHNAAAAHPTDFGLLEISSQNQNHVLTQFSQLAGVKDLHPDRQFTGKLQWQPEGELRQAFITDISFNPEDSKPATTDSSGSQRDAAQPDDIFNLTVSKQSGRFRTSFMMDGDYSDTGRQHTGHDRQLLTAADTWELSSSRKGRIPTPLLDTVVHDSTTTRRLLGRSSITSMLQADSIWSLGFTGAGVKVGVFDTGILPSHPHIRNIKERTNWTHQNSLSDGLGHGTFVAGVIGSYDRECPGLAPDVDLHTFKVFTDDQVSFTSWFLDAFNYAMLSGINVINLSIGGPDFLDQPFVDKVWEVTSSGILLVSAIGNDGPLYGTLNNPADQSDVIGVGGIDDYNAISTFSSRGMTSWELTLGSGRVKPDVMAYSKDVQGSKIHGGCRSLSGTSVASPVVAGAVCLLASTVPEAQRWQVLNPASMKQALIEGADVLPNLNIYEQGSGKLNLRSSMQVLKGYQPRASVVPSEIDLTDGSYMWPYSRQPLYHSALPVIFNATVLNALGVTGRFQEPPQFYALDEGGALLHVSFEWSEVLWPWSGYLALFVRVRESGRQYKGVAKGQVVFTIVSPPGEGESEERTSTVVMPLTVRIQPPPPRNKRLLWDQFHSIKYPPGYIPRDNLDIKHDILDWHGDHLYTNYHGLYNWLKDKDYYVEVLSSPATCFNASDYAAYLLVDSEDEFYKEEVSKVAEDVKSKGLNLIVFAEWYHVDSMLQMKFYDDNTRSWWTPVTGGSNVPALNDLLEPHGIMFGDAIIHGQVTLAGTRVHISYGVDIARMPPNSYVHTAPLSSMSSKTADGHYAYLGISLGNTSGSGSVVVFSDSNCLDSSHQVAACYEFLSKILDRVIKGESNGVAADANQVAQGWTKDKQEKPMRRPDINFTDYSFVLKNSLRCYSSGQCSQQPSAACSDFLDLNARTARAPRTLVSSTSVAINYSHWPAADKGNITAFVLARGPHSTGSAWFASNTVYLVSIACVIGVMLAVAIWQYAGKGKPRTERSLSNASMRLRQRESA